MKDNVSPEKDKENPNGGSKPNPGESLFPRQDPLEAYGSKRTANSPDDTDRKKQRSASPVIDDDALNRLVTIEVERARSMLDKQKTLQDLKSIALVLLEEKIFEKNRKELQYLKVRDNNRDIKIKLDSVSYLKYCEIIRNKIASFDAYVYHAGMPKFHIPPSDLEKFHDYNTRNKEKRRLRILFLVQNSPPEIHPDIYYLTQTYRNEGISDELFAKSLAEGYSQLSEIIKNICQGIVDDGNYSEHLTSFPWINYCISLLNNVIDFKVGEMKNVKDLSVANKA